MTYLVLLTILVFVGLNCFASVIVVRSRHTAKKQKLRQMFFVWLLPVIGSVFTISLLKETHRSTIGKTGVTEMRFDDCWLYSESACGHPPELWNHTPDHSCD